MTYRKDLVGQIEACIRLRPMTSRQIANELDHHRPSTITATVRKIPGAYVCNWIEGQGRPAAVWAYDADRVKKDAKREKVNP